MFKTVAAIFLYSMLFLKIAGVIIGYLNPSRKFNLTIKLIFYSFIMSVIGALLYMARIYKIPYGSEIFKYHTILSDILLSIILGIIVYNSVSNTSARKIVVLICIILNLLVIASFYLNGGGKEFNFALFSGRIATYLCEIILTLIYLLQLFKLTPVKKLSSDPAFWWIIGFLIADTIDFPLIFIGGKDTLHLISINIIKMSNTCIHILISLKAISCRPHPISLGSL